VEKIKRDIKITTIYEGTSEIQRRLIAMFRLQKTVRSKGGYYSDMAAGLEKLPEDCGAHQLASALGALNNIVLGARKMKLTKSQYVMFLLADMMTFCEVGDALCRKAAEYEGKDRTPEFMKASARLFARDVIEKVYLNGLRIAQGCDQTMDEAHQELKLLNLEKIMRGNLTDMNTVSAELVK
jgi:alkylation response protein AidB-like acyl-CoA dehydrogenase